MTSMRHGALLVMLLGMALSCRAAERAGPEPAEIIYPRSGETAAASGAPPARSPAAGLSATPSFTGLAPAAGYLVVLLVLAGGAWVLLKRGSLPRPFTKSEGKLRVLETRMLGNRQFLVVVEYEEAKMLIGVCPGRIDYLTPLTGHLLAASEGGDDETEIPAPLAGVVSERR
jgi:flagellar biosynthetic protein FliO